jgi:hypothetical protein
VFVKFRTRVLLFVSDLTGKPEKFSFMLNVSIFWDSFSVATRNLYAITTKTTTEIRFSYTSSFCSPFLKNLKRLPEFPAVWGC